MFPANYYGMVGSRGWGTAWGDAHQLASEIFDLELEG